MTKAKRTILDLSLSFGLTAVILISMCGFADSCKDMYDNIIRIRIIANSDSERDQALKLKVRDGILDFSKVCLKNCNTYDEAVEDARKNLDLFLKKAEDIVYQQGFDYSVKAELREEYFNTRAYDGFTLPAGNYETLVITLGNGKGENWWCVMFPQVCVGACAGKLSDTLEDKSVKYAENNEKYVLKFKFIEIFERLKKDF